MPTMTTAATTAWRDAAAPDAAARLWGALATVRDRKAAPAARRAALVALVDLGINDHRKPVRFAAEDQLEAEWGACVLMPFHNPVLDAITRPDGTLAPERIAGFVAECERTRRRPRRSTALPARGVPSGNVLALRRA